MNKMMKRCVTFVLAFVLAVSSAGVTGFPVQTVEAATTQSITKSMQVVCKKTAKVKVPGGYKNCKFTSSNPKVATVDKKGNFKALRLGVTKVTVQSGSQKKSYTITVVPAKKSDVYLKQNAFIVGQSATLALSSKKYDTSQIKLSVYATDFNSKGYASNITFEGTEQFFVRYGSWSKEVKIICYSAQELIDALIHPDYSNETVLAGATQSYNGCYMGFSPSDFNKSGIKMYAGNQLITDTMTYEPGEQVFRVDQGKKCIYKKKVTLHYDMQNIFKTRNTDGVDAECKEVLDALFHILDQIITDRMTDEQKVEAIHDYLIYNADYYSGDLDTRPGWSSAIKGVIINHSGVCNSYALAFYAMATIEGIPCKYISGTATNSVGKTGGHAWNQVKVGDKWYYVDCTWDDPTGGGYERKTYYLSEQLWSNHTQQTVTDLVTEKSYYSWENYYLTGKLWD